MNRCINSRLSKLMGERRSKISEVSRKTGISRTTLTKLYYGDGEAVSYGVLEKLCNYFGCGVGDILEMVGKSSASH